MTEFMYSFLRLGGFMFVVFIIIGSVVAIFREEPPKAYVTNKVVQTLIILLMIWMAVGAVYTVQAT